MAVLVSVIILGSVVVTSLPSDIMACMCHCAGEAAWSVAREFVVVIGKDKINKIKLNKLIKN